MMNDDLEFLISQYADGNLPPDRVPPLESRLASDPAARALLLEHRRVNELLRDPRALPSVNWDRLARAISQHIGVSEGLPEMPRLSFPIWRVAGAALALAACVAVGLVFLRGNGSGDFKPQPLAKVVQVIGPTAEASVGQKIAQVTLVAPPVDATEFSPDTELFGGGNVSILVAAGAQRPAADPFGGGF